MSTFEVTFNKTDKFSKTFSDKSEVKQIMSDYKEFFNNYRQNHSISSRTWKFPLVYVNTNVVFIVTPNGSLKPVEDWEKEKILAFEKTFKKFPIYFSQVN